MPLIPIEWLPTYYVANLIVAGMMAFVIWVDRLTMRMSTPHCVFFFLIAAGLFAEGVFGVAGSHDETLFQIAFSARVCGVYALLISIFLKTMIDRLSNRGKWHAR